MFGADARVVTETPPQEFNVTTQIGKRSGQRSLTRSVPSFTRIS